MKFEGLGPNEDEEEMRYADDGNPNVGNDVESAASPDPQPRPAEGTGRRVDSVSDPGSIDTFEHEGGLVPDRE